MKLLRTRITYDWSVMHIELTYHMSEGLKDVEDTYNDDFDEDDFEPEFEHDEF